MNLVEILKHIEELYGSEDVEEKKIEQWLAKYPERAKAWQDGLGKYEDYDIKQAIDEYWRFKDSETRPRLVHIQAMLNTQKIESEQTEDVEKREKLALQAEKTKEELRKKMIEKWGV